MFRSTLLSALVAAVLAASPVLAQTAPPDAASGAPAGPMRPGGPMQRVRAMHDRLGITAAQEPQWDALVAALRDNARAMREDPAAQALRSGQAAGLARLRAAVEVERARAEGMQRLLPAVEALYAVLTPAQQQIADREIDRLTHRGPGRG